MDEVYLIMCSKSSQLQAVKKNVGVFDQHDLIYNQSTGIRLLGIQLLKNETSEDLFWIPRQEQIQKMVLKHYNIEKLIDDFDDFCLTSGFLFNEQDITFEKLWIMFYMEKIENMYWCWSCNIWRLLKYKNISN